MSDHSHHEHGHTHVGFKGANVTFIVLGTLEIVLGALIANPAVTNLGVHDLSDVSIPVIGGLVATLTVRLHRHWPKCQAEVWAAFLIGVSNIVVIGGITLISIPSGINRDQLTLGVVSAIVSFAANYYWAGKLHCETDVMRRAVSKHLRLDAYAAAAVGVGSVVSYRIGSIWPAVIAAGAVLILTVWHSVPELVELRREFHRERNHLHLVVDDSNDHDHDHDHHH